MGSGNRSAVIVGMDLNGLGVARSLAAGGVDIHLLDTNVTKPTMRTRFGIKWPVQTLSRDPSSGHSIADELMALRREFTEDPVLFLTQEQTVVEVSSRRRQIIEKYRITLPASNVASMLLDKASFQSFAEAHGFPVPRSVTLDGNESPGLTLSLDYPCILKPVEKFPEYGRRFKKAYKVEAPAEALRLFHDASAYAPRMIVQEWVEGADSDVYFCLQYRNAAGTALTSFVGRKIRQWPPLTGGTASCLPAPEQADELEALTNKFFDACGFVGLGSMEFKYDRRRGRFYMIEPTVCRTDYQEEVATLNGVNIPLAAYCAESGLDMPAPSESRASDVVWCDPIGQANARRLQPDIAAERLIAGVVIDAYFRLHDPGPWLYLKWEGVRRRILRAKKWMGCAC
jgi:predicted ATP-grasp superfamily ATP-dependent carboligase